MIAARLLILRSLASHAPTHRQMTSSTRGSGIIQSISAVTMLAAGVAACSSKGTDGGAVSTSAGAAGAPVSANGGAGAAGQPVSVGGSASDSSAAGAGGTFGLGGAAGSAGTLNQAGSAGANAGAGGTASAQLPRRTAAEVLLVTNSKSPTSVAVADDYAQKRSIMNRLSIQCADSALKTDNETIELADYTSSIATPIATYLAAHPAINFIVLTKGIPIRVNGAKTGCCQGNDAAHPTGAGQPSVDSYLAAMDYPTLAGAVKIGITGSGTVGSGYLNRYWNATVPFTHAQFGGYIVTRLDGYTEADAKALVTRALAAEQAPGTGKILLDVDGARGLGDKATEPAPVTKTVTEEWGWETWNADMLHAHDQLEASGIANTLDLTTKFQGGPAGLLGYFSWGSNDANFDAQAYAALTFAPGSLADTAVSTSGRTFLSPHDNGQSLMADLIAHGLTCGKAYVGEPLLQGIASPTIALSRYHAGFSAAESLAAASRFTGWEDVLIGDPLGTPYFGAAALAKPLSAAKFDASSPKVMAEDCAEGGQDLAFIDNGAYSAYKNLDLGGAQSFAARVASGGSGGKIEIHADSQTGPLLGTCSVPVTGNYQTWATQTCPLSGASGTHDVYLVYTGSGASLFNVQWFALRAQP